MSRREQSTKKMRQIISKKKQIKNTISGHTIVKVKYLVEWDDGVRTWEEWDRMGGVCYTLVTQFEKNGQFYHDKEHGSQYQGRELYYADPTNINIDNIKLSPQKIESKIFNSNRPKPETTIRKSIDQKTQQRQQQKNQTNKRDRFQSQKQKLRQEECRKMRHKKNGKKQIINLESSQSDRSSSPVIIAVNQPKKSEVDKMKTSFHQRKQTSNREIEQLVLQIEDPVHKIYHRQTEEQRMERQAADRRIAAQRRTQEMQRLRKCLRTSTRSAPDSQCRNSSITVETSETNVETFQHPPQAQQQKLQYLPQQSPQQLPQQLSQQEEEEEVEVEMGDLQVKQISRKQGMKGIHQSGISEEEGNELWRKVFRNIMNQMYRMINAQYWLNPLIRSRKCQRIRQRKINKKLLDPNYNPNTENRYLAEKQVLPMPTKQEIQCTEYWDSCLYRFRYFQKPHKYAQSDPILDKLLQRQRLEREKWQEKLKIKQEQQASLSEGPPVLPEVPIQSVKAQVSRSFITIRAPESKKNDANQQLI